MQGFARIILAAAVLAVGAGSASAQARIALVIGNSAYEEGSLANPVNDAQLIASALRQQGFEVIERLDVDQRRMMRALKDFGDRLEAAHGDAIGLFYYAGHAVQVGGENYLVPVGAVIEDEGDVEFEAVSAGSILRTIAFARNRLNIVILDACRDNPYARSFRSPARGLARIDAPSGTLIAFATAPGKVALDGSGANSSYTAALAKAIAEPGVPLEQMFRRVRHAVRAETGGRQTPWESSSLTGDFYFAAAATATEPIAEPDPETAFATKAFDEKTFELAFWDAIRDSEDPADFEGFLSRFPEGVFSGLARRQLKELEETEVAAVPPPPRPATEPEPETAPAAVDAPDFDERAIELAFWDSIKDGTDLALFEDYLRTFPQGAFAAIAVARLNELIGPESRAFVHDPPGPEQEAEYTSIERYPVMEFDRDEVALDETLTVVFWLSEQTVTPEVRIAPGPDTEVTGAGAIATTLPGKGPWPIRAVLSAPAFDLVEGSKSRLLTLPAKGDSSPALYVLQPRTAGDTSETIRITLWHEGSYLARVSRSVRVLQADNTANLVRRESGPVQEQPAAPARTVTLD